MQTLIIKDETVSGKVVHELKLNFDLDTITVADLIRVRVKQEVAKYQQSIDNYNVHSLVTPSKVEARLNNRDGKKPQRAKINMDKQIKLALDAFERNSFFILFNEEQVEDLQQELFVTPQSKVSFIKLTPLVGG